MVESVMLITVLGDAEFFWKVIKKFIIRKGTKSQGDQQSWLKNLAQFHIDWYAILNVVLTLPKETVFKYDIHKKWQKAKIKIPFCNFCI